MMMSSLLMYILFIFLNKFIPFSYYLVNTIDTSVISDIETAFQELIKLSIYGIVLYLVLIPIRVLRNK